MRISDWSSDVCSSDLDNGAKSLAFGGLTVGGAAGASGAFALASGFTVAATFLHSALSSGSRRGGLAGSAGRRDQPRDARAGEQQRSEERRVGKGCVSPGCARWLTYHYK